MERPTVAIYEREASEWDRRRTARRVDLASIFAARVRAGGLRLDVGCGPGKFLTALGSPVVALDAARAMLDLAGERAPKAWRVQADLEHLPFRDRAFAGAWAVASYVHLPRVRVPMALAHLHWALEPGAAVHLVFFAGTYEGAALPGDDFPGRFFSQWDPPMLADVVAGAGFAIESLVIDRDRIGIDAVRSRSLPDTVGPDMRLLVCGLNPSLTAADHGVAFFRAGNRFWPAAIAAGLVTRDRDPRRALTTDGIGMTDLVKRATAGTSELARDEYRAGLERIERLAEWLRPAAVCCVGLEGWRIAVDRRAAPGVQPATLGGAPVYLMPSTSGRNARTPFSDMIAHLWSAGDLAGR